jgi:glycerophosphoryl diester phosphodiesterase
MAAPAAAPLLIAHRLGRSAGPDSSEQALAHTLRGPATGLETDVCLTADGELVLLHDPWLAMSTTADGWIHEVTWAQLRDARLRDRDGVPTDQRLLRVDDLLDRAPADLLLQFDVKVHGDQALAARTALHLAGRLRDRGATQRSEVLSFHATACAAVAATGQRTRLIVWADHDPLGLIRWAHGHGVAGVCVEHFLLHRDLVTTLRQGGLSVATGTVNDPELARRMAALQLDAVTTDAPDRVAAAVASAAADAQLARSTAMIRG